MGERRASPFPVQGKHISVGYTEPRASCLPAAPWPGSLRVKFPPDQNVFALTVNLRGESVGMEKLTQPYLRRSDGAGEESEPWLMSGLKLSPFFPANCIPLPWSLPSPGAHPSGSVAWSREVRLRFQAALSSPMAAPGSSVQQPRVLRGLLPRGGSIALPGGSRGPSRGVSPCLWQAIILAGDVQVTRSPRAVSDTAASDCCSAQPGVTLPALGALRARADGLWNFLPALLPALR